MKSRRKGCPSSEGRPLWKQSCCGAEWNSVVADVSDFEWNDGKWMKDRKKYDDRRQPVSIYETSLGKWNNKKELVSFLKEEGYTHVELHPVMEFLEDEADGYPISAIFCPLVHDMESLRSLLPLLISFIRKESV